MGKRHEDLVTVQIALRLSRSALATGVVDAALRWTFKRCEVCGRRLYRVGLTGGDGEPVEPMYLCNGCEQIFSIGKQRTRHAWNRALYDWLIGTVVPYAFEFEDQDDPRAPRDDREEGEAFDDDGPTAGS